MIFLEVHLVAEIVGEVTLVLGIYSSVLLFLLDPVLLVALLLLSGSPAPPSLLACSS
jgi:hypothetical protein